MSTLRMVAAHPRRSRPPQRQPGDRRLYSIVAGGLIAVTLFCYAILYLPGYIRQWNAASGKNAPVSLIDDSDHTPPDSPDADTAQPQPATLEDAKTIYLNDRPNRISKTAQDYDIEMACAFFLHKWYSDCHAN